MKTTKRLRTFARIGLALSIIAFVASLWSVSHTGSLWIYEHFSFMPSKIDGFLTMLAGPIIIAILIFFILSCFSVKEMEIEDAEKWGHYLPSLTGVEWKLPRNFISNKKEDSSELLKNMGFRNLGTVDEIMYKVEPPMGWKYGEKEHGRSTVYDQTGTARLGIYLEDGIVLMGDNNPYIRVTEYHSNPDSSKMKSEN
jgi:hypothetical protein